MLLPEPLAWFERFDKQAYADNTSSRTLAAMLKFSRQRLNQIILKRMI